MNLRYPGYLDTLGNILVTNNNYDKKKWTEKQVWCAVRIYIGWCLHVLGDDSTTQELLLNDDGKKVRIAELYHAENGIKFGVRSWVHTIKRNQCYSRGKSSLEEFSIPALNLVDDVSTWLPGNIHQSQSLVSLSLDIRPQDLARARVWSVTYRETISNMN